MTLLIDTTVEETEFSTIVSRPIGFTMPKIAVQGSTIDDDLDIDTLPTADDDLEGEDLPVSKRGYFPRTREEMKNEYKLMGTDWED